jgi:hypothetical protein
MEKYDHSVGSLLKCKSCTKCSGVFTVDPAVHALNRSFVGDLKEHGGNFAIDFHRKVLIHGKLSIGEYNSLSMDRGVVDFHSHPRKCLNDKTCAIGVPSPDDLINILVGAVYGTIGHLLYAASGTYVIKVRPSLVKSLISSQARLRSYARKTRETMMALDHRFQGGQMNYVTYKNEWLRLARKCGFIVRIFKGDDMPSISIPYSCYYSKQNQRPVLAEINIPYRKERWLQEI